MSGTIGYSDWDDVAPESKSSRGSSDRPVYLKLTGGMTYRIRPVHRPVEFCKFFHKDDEGKLRTATCRDDEVIKRTMDSHPDLDRPSSRYAIYVLDRADGVLKIMEAPITVFRPFRVRFDATGEKPGGKDGGDWQIRVVGSGKIDRKYETTFLENTPFSKSEMKMIEEHLSDESKRLPAIYKSHDIDEIEKRLFGSFGKQKDDDPEETESTVPAGSSVDNEDGDDFSW